MTKLLQHCKFYDSLQYILLFGLGQAVSTAERLKNHICVGGTFIIFFNNFLLHIVEFKYIVCSFTCISAEVEKYATVRPLVM